VVELFLSAALLLSVGVHLRMAWRLRRAEAMFLESLAMEVRAAQVH